MRWVASVGLQALLLAACGSSSGPVHDRAARDEPTTGVASNSGGVSGSTATGPRSTTTRPPEPPSPASSIAEPAPDEAATTAQAPTPTTPQPEANPSPAPAPPDPPPPTGRSVPSVDSVPSAQFSSEILLIDGATAARMGASWREGCPVPLADLRLVKLSHWGYDGTPRTGELVVHADVAGAVVEVFGRLFDLRFPVERMELVDVFEADDDASMAANNTSAFNCRTATGSDRWSEHAYGRAIDVNPLVNPYVNGSYVAPPGGSAYLDRSAAATGLIRAGDGVVEAFAAAGWSWGGYWSSPKDYQHFSRSGR